MVSDFIDETNDFLCLTQKEYDQAKQSDPNIGLKPRLSLSMVITERGFGMAKFNT